MVIVKCIKENDTGRNILFQNIGNHEIMDRKTFVSRIKNSSSIYHQDYVVKKINGVDTPVSKPDNSKNNNLE